LHSDSPLVPTRRQDLSLTRPLFPGADPVRQIARLSDPRGRRRHAVTTLRPQPLTR
jgi:hypothetical protein